MALTDIKFVPVINSSIILNVLRGHLDSRVVFTLNFWTLECYALGHEVDPWWQLFFFRSSITSTLNFQRIQSEGSRITIFILLFVKKLLKFVLFTKVCWKSQKWRIKLFKKILNVLRFSHTLGGGGWMRQKQASWANRIAHEDTTAQC